MNATPIPFVDDDPFFAMEAIGEAFPFPLFWIDCDGLVLGANRFALEFYGFDREDFLVGCSLYDLYPIRIADIIMQHNGEVIDSGQILSQSESYIDAEQRNWAFDAMKIPLKDARGLVVGILVLPE